MNQSQPKLNFSTIQITKAVDQGSFIPLEEAYMVNMNLQETGVEKKDRFRNNSGLSTIYNVTYVQLTPDKKVLILGIEDRKVLPKISHSLGQQVQKPPTQKTQQNQSSQDVEKLLKKYEKIKNQKLQQGFSFKKVFGKYSDQKYCTSRIQQLYKQLDGKPFFIYRLGINEQRNSINQVQQIISVTFLNMCGRNIVQQALNISQSKSLPEFHTKKNYKKQIQTVLQYCISRMKNPSTSDDMDTKPQLAFQLDKQIIKSDGQIVPIKTKLFLVNPLLFYFISQIVQSNQPKKYDSSFVNFVSKNQQAVSFKGLFQTQPHASYKQKQQDATNNIEIISKVYKN